MHPDYSQLKIKPSDLIHRHKLTDHSGRAGEACGCCPACGAFVVIEKIDEATGTACPACGLIVDRLAPLGEAT